MFIIPILISQQKESLRTKETLRLKKPSIHLLFMRIIVVMAMLVIQICHAKLQAVLVKCALIYRKVRKANLPTTQPLISILSLLKKFDNRVIDTWAKWNISSVTKWTITQTSILSRSQKTSTNLGDRRVNDWVLFGG